MNKGCTIWLTGLSGSGKTTIALALKKWLDEKGYSSYILDGDNIRQGLCNDLGFSPEDRKENIRRIGEVAKLMTDAGLITIVSFISPYRKDRLLVRMCHGKLNFLECLVDAPLDVCKERDPKGLYKKALSGEIPEFTGISAPYERPINPDVVLKTELCSVNECVAKIMVKLLRCLLNIPQIETLSLKNVYNINENY